MEYWTESVASKIQNLLEKFRGSQRLFRMEFIILKRPKLAETANP